jgi:hypothetical protein
MKGDPEEKYRSAPSSSLTQSLPLKATDGSYYLAPFLAIIDSIGHPLGKSAVKR